MSQQTDAFQALTTLRDALTTCLDSMPLVECWLPVTVRNEANQRDRWGATKRAKAHRTAARLTVFAPLRRASRPTPFLVLHPHGLVVLLTRVYSGRGRPMDDDGVARALKAVRDGVADALGVNDGSDCVTWVVAQERGSETGVRVQIFARRALPDRDATIGVDRWSELG